MGSERWSVTNARSRNAWEDSTTPVSLACLGTAVRTVAIPAEPIAVVEHHRLVADRTIRRRNPGHRAQDVKVQVVVVFVSHMLPILFEPERLFGAFPGRHADKLQFAVNDRRRRGTNRMPFGQLLAVGKSKAAARIRWLRKASSTDPSSINSGRPVLIKYDPGRIRATRIFESQPFVSGLKSRCNVTISEFFSSSSAGTYSMPWCSAND